MSGFGSENPFYGNGGGGGGGGGGYLSQNSPFGSGGSPGGTARRAASHALRPVTLKQLVDASQAHSDADWVIGDVEIGQVTVVAQVLSVQPQTTNCIYFLHDGTAAMEARQWMDPNTEEENKNREEIKENNYVRVLGSLKVFGNKRYITATHIKPYKGVDELFFHILEAATVTLTFERGPPPRPSEGAHALTNRVKNNAGGHSAYTARASAPAANVGQFSHLPPLQRHIIEFILAQPKTDEGIHVAAIARQVATILGPEDGSAHKISAALDHLMDQGHVFSTLDDSHFNVSE
ncbi:replication protein A subunit RPA32 [Lenzites betulinus]|nr:replication protein A subunit RPA32 [Lenzites betulinus]